MKSEASPDRAGSSHVKELMSDQETLLVVKLLSLQVKERQKPMVDLKIQPNDLIWLSSSS